MEAAKRWQRLVTARLAETERLDPGRGPTGPAFWDRRAPRFAKTWSVDGVGSDPFFRVLRRWAKPSATMVDVGAGPGRFSLGLAPNLARMTAVDVSPAMLRALRRRARESGIANVTTVVGSWPGVDVEQADVCFSSFVLPLVADAPAFLRKMDATARRQVLLYLGAFSNDVLLDPLWRHFHGRSRKPGATWLDAVAVVREMGISPEVQVVEVPYRARFADLDEAVREYRDLLVLGRGAAVDRELRSLLGDWLLRRKDHLVPPMEKVAAAILRWEPSSGAPYTSQL